MKFSQFRKRPGPKFNQITWSPHWEIVLVYEHPDTSTAGEFPKHTFRNRHVRPNLSHDWSPRVTRDTPGMDETQAGCHVSAAALPPNENGEGERFTHSSFWKPDELRGGTLYRDGDGRTAHQRDWDALSEAVDQAFARDGVTAASATIDKIRSLVTLQDAHRGKVYPSRNPADVLKYSSFCTGAANLLAALCSIAGIPARNLNNAVHSMTEVWDGKRWIFSDNLPKEMKALCLKGEPESSPTTLLEHLNYSQLLLAPSNPDGSVMPAPLRERYSVLQPEFEPYINTATADWRFDHGSVGMDRNPRPTSIGVGLFAQPCPDNIGAIYPEWDDPHFFSIPGRENELILNPRQGWFHCAARLDRRMGMQKTFHLGELGTPGNPLKSVRCDLHLVEGFGPEFQPGRAGWQFYVNDQEVPLDRDRFLFRSGLLSIEIPIEKLREGQSNTITLRSDKPYPMRPSYRMRDMLPFWVYPDVLGIEAPWYGDEHFADYSYLDASASGNGPVVDSHSGWLVVPEGL